MTANPPRPLTAEQVAQIKAAGFVYDLNRLCDSHEALRAALAEAQSGAASHLEALGKVAAERDRLREQVARLREALTWARDYAIGFDHHRSCARRLAAEPGVLGACDCGYSAQREPMNATLAATADAPGEVQP